MENKIIGYLLVVIGVFIMFLTAYFVFNVFTKKVNPINVVSESSLFMPTNIDKGSVVGLMNIDMKEIANLANISFSLVLGGFLLNVGFKLASLGVMLARPIVVDIKAKENKLSSA